MPILPGGSGCGEKPQPGDLSICVYPSPVPFTAYLAVAVLNWVDVQKPIDPSIVWKWSR